MKNKLYLLLILLTIFIASFPSICFSELKTVQVEYCEIYMGDMKNKTELDKVRKTVRTKSIENGIIKVINEKDLSINTECVLDIQSNYLKKVKVVSHTEKGRKICESLQVTSDTEVIKEYLYKTMWGKCLVSTITITKDDIIEIWCSKVEEVLRKEDVNNIGLVVETRIPNFYGQNLELIKDQEEEEFLKLKSYDTMKKVKIVDRRHLNKILEEQKLSSSGITDSDTVKLGKLLNLDIIVLRFIYENSNVTKVLKVDTGEVLLLKTYEK